MTIYNELDITVERTYRSALGALSAAQKSGAGVPAYLRWVNRGLGRKAAAVSYVFGLTPNVVTLISALASLSGMLLIAFTPPRWETSVAAVLLLLLGYALDSADGQLARLTKSGSAAGEWLDHVVDAVRLPAFHLAIAASFMLRPDPGDRWPAAVALVFMIVASVWFFGQILAASLSKSPASAPGSDAALWVSFAKIPYDVSFLYLIILTLPLVGLFSALYISLFCVTVLVAVVSLLRKYRSLAGTSSPAGNPVGAQAG